MDNTITFRKYLQVCNAGSPGDCMKDQIAKPNTLAR